MRCEEIQEMLPSYGAGDDSLTVRRHLARCTDCKRELARYQELRSSLATMRTIGAEPPSDLLPALYAIADPETRIAVVKTHLARNKKTYAGVAVAIAGAAGAALWRSRSSRRLAPA
jgi:anti-sigma factor RsiW